MKRIFQKFISYFSYGLDYKFLKWETEPELTKLLSDIVIKKAEEVAHSEDIPVFYLSCQELNEEFVRKEEPLANGVYYFLKTGERFNGFYKNYIYPRIELNKDDEKYGWTTFLHELGHHFCITRKNDHTEESADRYIEEFFDTYLPPFFKWALQTTVHCFAHIPEIKYTREENYKYWKEAEKFLKQSSNGNI